MKAIFGTVLAAYALTAQAFEAGDLVVFGRTPVCHAPEQILMVHEAGVKHGPAAGAAKLWSLLKTGSCRFGYSRTGVRVAKVVGSFRERGAKYEILAFQFGADMRFVALKDPRTKSL